MLKKIIGFCLIIGSNLIYAATTVVTQSLMPQTGESAVVNGTTVPLGLDGNPGSTYGVSWPITRFTFQPSPYTGESGCITDNLTGLMWVSNIKDTDLNSIIGSSMNYTSSTTGDLVLAAITAVNALNMGAGYCGHNDWRLPNVNELHSLVNYGQSNPSSWLNSTGYFTNVQASHYWSSSLYAPNPTFYAWAVYFVLGSTTNDGQAGSNDFVWPVRAGQ